MKSGDLPDLTGVTPSEMARRTNQAIDAALQLAAVLAQYDFAGLDKVMTALLHLLETEDEFIKERAAEKLAIVRAAGAFVDAVNAQPVGRKAREHLQAAIRGAGVTDEPIVSYDLVREGCGTPNCPDCGLPMPPKGSC